MGIVRRCSFIVTSILWSILELVRIMHSDKSRDFYEIGILSQFNYDIHRPTQMFKLGSIGSFKKYADCSNGTKNLPLSPVRTYKKIFMNALLLFQGGSFPFILDYLYASTNQFVGIHSTTMLFKEYVLK